MAKVITLKNALKDIKPNTLVYIGTDKGTNFLWIETVDKLLVNLDMMENQLKDASIDILTAAKSKVKNRPRTIVNLQDTIKDLQTKLAGIDDEDLEKELKATEVKLREAESEYANSFFTVKKVEAYIRNWVSIEKRKVLDIRKHTVDNPGITIIIDGTENGYLWFKDEETTYNRYSLASEIRKIS